MLGVVGELSITYRDGEICTAQWRRVFVTIWLEAGTLEAIRAMDRMEGRFAALHRRFSLLNIVPDVPMRRPPTGVSEVASDMLKRYGPQLVGAAIVLGGSGFLPSLARSIMSGALLVSRSKAPTKYCASIGDAAAWLAGLPDQTDDFDQRLLATEAEALMREVGARL